MKKFSFSLQSVQDHRALRRDTAERAFGDAALAVSGAEAALEDRIRERNEAVEAYLHTVEQGAVDPQELALRISHIASLVEYENLARTKLKLLNVAKEARRRDALAAARDEKAITNLRDRHQARHNTEVARIEQTNLDELANLAFARRCK